MGNTNTFILIEYFTFIYIYIYILLQQLELRIDGKFELKSHGKKKANQLGYKFLVIE